MQKLSLSHKLLLLLFNQNTSSGFTPSGFIARVFLYSGVLITLILPSIDKLGGPSIAARNKETTRMQLGELIRAQKNYRLETGSFANSVDQLGMPLPNDSYTFRIISPMIPVAEAGQPTNSPQSIQSVFTIAQPKPEYSRFFKSYIVAFFEDNQGYWAVGICEMNQVKTLPTALPSLKGNQEIQCPPGSTLIY